METLFQNINEGMNCKIFLWLRHLLPSNPLISYLQYETNHTCQQPSPRFAWILPICIIIFPIIDQCRYFLPLWPWSSNVYWFWATQIPKSDPKKSTGFYVAKMFCLQSRQIKVFGYNGIWCKKKSKLTLCFSVLLL